MREINKDKLEGGRRGGFGKKFSIIRGGRRHFFGAARLEEELVIEEGTLNRREGRGLLRERRLYWLRSKRRAFEITIKKRESWKRKR